MCIKENPLNKYKLLPPAPTIDIDSFFGLNMDSSNSLLLLKQNKAKAK